MSFPYHLSLVYREDVAASEPLMFILSVSDFDHRPVDPEEKPWFEIFSATAPGPAFRKGVLHYGELENGMRRAGTFGEFIAPADKPPPGSYLVVCHVPFLKNSGGDRTVTGRFTILPEGVG